MSSSLSFCSGVFNEVSGTSARFRHFGSSKSKPVHPQWGNTIVLCRLSDRILWAVFSTNPNPASELVRSSIETGVVLTFDDGPNSDHTPAILDELASSEVQACFFVVGSHLDGRQPLVERMVAEGHQVGSHGWLHERHSNYTDDQVGSSLAKTSEALQAITGIATELFRPPYGDHDARVAEIARELGQATWLWSVDAQDWEEPGAEEIEHRILDQVQDGAVILLHDGRGDRSQTVAALGPIAASLTQRGFTITGLPEMT